MKDLVRDTKILSEALMNHGSIESRFSMTTANFMVHQSAGMSEDEVMRGIAEIGQGLGLEPERAAELFDEVLDKLKASMEMLDKLNAQKSEKEISEMSISDVFSWSKENR